MSAELVTPWEDGEGDFAHGSNDNKPAKGYMITIFRPDWTLLHNNDTIEVDWSQQLSFDDIQSGIATVAPELSITYMHYTIELCPSTDKVHAHLIIYFDKSTRFKRFLSCEPISSWERKEFRAIYNLDGAVKYCSKTHTKAGVLTRISGPYTWGNLPTQGKRNDLEAAIVTLQDNNWDTRSVAIEHPAVFVKFNKGLDRLADVRASKPPADNITDIICIVGFPGSGKSTFAHSIDPDSTYSRGYPKYSNYYFDGYRNENVLLIDEFSGHLMQFEFFKRLFQPGMDPRRNTLPMRESSMPMGSSKVVIISNRLPTFWWDLGKLRANPRELFRRFTSIYFFGGEYGSESNPSWNKCFTGDERYEFMDVCIRAKAESWDDDHIQEIISYKYKPKPDQESHSDDDITQHTRARKRTRYMNLQPQDQPFFN